MQMTEKPGQKGKEDQNSIGFDDDDEKLELKEEAEEESVQRLRNQRIMAKIMEEEIT